VQTSSDTFPGMFDKIQRAQSSFHQAVTAWNKFNTSADLEDVLVADAVFRYSILSGCILTKQGMEELHNIFHCPEKGPSASQWLFILEILNLGEEGKTLKNFHDHILEIPHRFHMDLAQAAAHAANKAQSKLLIEVTQFIQDYSDRHSDSFLTQRQSPQV